MEGVIDKSKRRLDLHLNRWERQLPAWAGRVLGWLRKPSARWVRIPIGLLLVAAGLLGFLPVLGFWMAIPGLLLLAIDVPTLRGPLRRLGVWLRRTSQRLRARKR